MMKLSKVSILASIVGKFAYAITSVMMLTKSVGKKAYRKLNYRACWAIEIASTETGVIILENRRKTVAEIASILESFEGTKVQITLKGKE